MTAGPTTPTQLGAATLVRKWYLDVNTGDSTAAVWTHVNGIMSLVPNVDAANWADSSTFDTAGAQTKTKTASAWSVTGKVLRAVTAALATAYDPGQEYLRTAAVGKYGLDNQVEIRFYEFNGANGPQIEAYHGFAGVEWAADGGSMPDLDIAAFTLNAQSALDQITYPASA